MRNTINEIAYANNIRAEQAQQKFYKDIEEQYDDKLGFELQLNGGQDLKEQNQKMLSILAYSKPLVEFLDGSAHSFSNDEDNVKILASIIPIYVHGVTATVEKAEEQPDKNCSCISLTNTVFFA